MNLGAWPRARGRNDMPARRRRYSQAHHSQMVSSARVRVAVAVTIGQVARGIVAGEVVLSKW